MKDKRIYCITKSGKFISPVIENEMIQMLEGFGFNVIDVGHGSAYNMPIYLLGELEKYFDEAIVFAWNESGTDSAVVGFISGEEKLELLEALERAKGRESSYEICMRLYE